MSEKSEILYEPMPVGRIGVRLSDKQVVVAKDFSTYGYMLEEYISYGAVNIVFPKSAPECELITQMPAMLQNRIKIVDDSNEQDIVNRLLYSLRKEFNVKQDEISGNLKFAKNTTHDIIRPIECIHNDLKKLSMGFNHRLQINLNTAESIKSLQFIRKSIVDNSQRLILAQLESTLNQYEEFHIDAMTTPKNSTPTQLINIFDKLINDPLYTNYSTAIASLGVSKNKDLIAQELRVLSRSIGEKNYIATGWDYFTKILQLWLPVPILDSSAIATLIKHKNFPVLINMDAAKSRVLENWKHANFSSYPISRNGSILSEEKIDWMPTTNLGTISGQDGTFFSLGKVKDLLKVLLEFKAQSDNGLSEP
jgi:hypothetical protein